MRKRIVGPALAIVAAATMATRAHSGPPFPIVTDARHGPYVISIWTDPDATDDRTPGGQFWIVLAPAARGVTLPRDTRASVSVRPLGSSSHDAVQSATAEPVNGDVTNQFGAVVMEREGPFAVHVEVTGPLGAAAIETMVEATYDLRPPPYMLIWYLFPFVLVGIPWARLLMRRRSAMARQRTATAAGKGPAAGGHAP